MEWEYIIMLLKIFDSEYRYPRKTVWKRFCEQIIYQIIDEKRCIFAGI